jgi:putative FmdB family regulatory protein
MPIHAYECRACGTAFSTLVRGGETAECPACSSPDLERQLSLPARSPKGDDVAAACAPGGGPCCGPMGGCPAFAGD